MSTTTPRGKGRPALLQAEHQRLLVELTQRMAQSSMEELTREFVRQTGITVRAGTIRKALKKAGIQRVRPMRRAGTRAAVQGQAPQRYGYTAMHRRQAKPGGMNTDLTDAEWSLVGELFKRQTPRGAPATHERRDIVNACMYIVRTGCAWRLLPGNFPPWRAVYSAFRGWAHAGILEAMHDRLRQQWRDRVGKAPEPSAAIIDSQSTRGTPQGGDTGFDAGKKVKGRKRHLVLDTLGLLLAVSITAASVQDRDGAVSVVAQACAKVTGLKKLYADAAYGGQCAMTLEKTHGIAVEIVRHPANRVTGTFVQEGQQPLWLDAAPKGFVVQAKRWVVERTHAWNERARRLIAHHDRSNWAPVAWVWLTEARILAARLAA
jgi:putative transposase